MPLQPRFTAAENILISQKGYRHELGLLRQIINSAQFEQLLPLFADYRKNVISSQSKPFADALLDQLADANNLINVADPETAANILFTCANLAAACEIFHGWSLDRNTLNNSNHEHMLAETVMQSPIPLNKLGESMAVRLNRGDAVRVAQIVKRLGLIPDQADRFHQLALGAAMGHRDRHGFHCIPGIGPIGPGAAFNVAAPLNFAVLPQDPASLCLIDNDPGLKAGYAEINAAADAKVRALHADMMLGLASLEKLVSTGAMQAPNLITLYRLEPTAFTNLGQFVDKLHEVVSTDSYFLATIGSGDDAAQLQQRFQVLDQLQADFQQRNYSPVRIKLYSAAASLTDGADQLPTPLFGLGQYASYEILFCQLQGNGSSKGDT
jgi:hypothetical protein